MKYINGFISLSYFPSKSSGKIERKDTIFLWNNEIRSRDGYRYGVSFPYFLKVYIVCVSIETFNEDYLDRYWLSFHVTNWPVFLVWCRLITRGEQLPDNDSSPLLWVKSVLIWLSNFISVLFEVVSFLFLTNVSGKVRLNSPKGFWELYFPLSNIYTLYYFQCNNVISRKIVSEQIKVHTYNLL